jgi:glycosyltransferase involved in cell wall biosynthesis
MAPAEKIVIVMPAYNASRTLEETVRAIPKGYYDEIVVVDDHSRDDTVERARALGLKATWCSAPGCSCRGRRSGAACRCGSASPTAS